MIKDVPELQRIKKGRRHDIQLNHGFRKRTNTILKLESNVNSNIAEKILGHKNGLDGVYFTPTRQQCFVEFCKGIPELTISDKERSKIKIKELTVEKTRFERMESQIQTLQGDKVELEREHEKMLDSLVDIAMKKSEAKFKKMIEEHTGLHLIQNKELEEIRKKDETEMRKKS